MDTGETPIRIMIVDDHAVVRQGIASLLSGCDDIVVVASVDGVEEALLKCEELVVDVVLMDLSMPEVDGVTGTELVLARHPEVRVVVLTGFVDRAAIRAAIDAGARAGLLKTVGMDELADSIRGVMQGRSTFSSEFLPYLLGRDREVDDSHRVLLTARELDILTLLSEGRTNRGIADDLGLSEGTVRVYVSTILTKMGAANRTEATAMAIRQGIVAPVE